MNPIWEKSNDSDTGYEFDYLIARFIQICRDHLATGRAKSFAFIFYDLHDDNFSKLLSDPGTFTRLDRLSGHNLTIFYLDRKSHSLTLQFNETIGRLFDVPADTRLPYILFFSFNNDDVDHITIEELTEKNQIFIYHTLFAVISAHIEQIKSAERPRPPIWKRLGHMLYRTVPKIFLEKGIEYLIASGGDSLKQYLNT